MSESLESICYHLMYITNDLYISGLRLAEASLKFMIIAILFTCLNFLFVTAQSWSSLFGSNDSTRREAIEGDDEAASPFLQVGGK